MPHYRRKATPRRPAKKTASKKRKKPQRPFYKSADYNVGLKGKPTQKRFMHWVCSPENPNLPAESTPFTENLYWRIFRIMAEFIEGFEFLSKLHHEVTFFGSARAPKNGRYYKAAEELGQMCAKAGFTVITGGGPGIMEAGNKGAYNGGGESVGLDIELPTEQRRNDYVTRAIGFHYFFTRKVMLSASAQAYVFFPGGFGTLNEATEMVDLVQTGKTPREVPCIFYGRAFWMPFFNWLRKTVYEENAFVNSEDLNLIRIVDTTKEAFDIIKQTRERAL